MKNLALFDFDHVIYNGQSFLDIVKYEIELERIIPAVEEEILTLLSKYKSEDLSYNQTLSGMLEVFCKSLKGIKYSDLLYDSINYFNSNPDSFFSYFNLILPDLKKTYDVYLITANTKFIAQAVVKKYKLAGFISSRYEVKNNIFTGNIKNSLAGDKQVVSSLVLKYGKKNSIAIGDSENDIGMLQQVESPICLNPTKNLLQYALDKNWKVINDTNALSELNTLLKSIK